MRHARLALPIVLVSAIVIAGLHARDQTAQPAGLPQAVAAIQKQEWDAAIAILEPLAKSQPGNPQVWRFLGLAYHSKKDLDKAMAAHLKAAESGKLLWSTDGPAGGQLGLGIEAAGDTNKDGSLIRAWTGKVMGETFGFDATGMGDVNGDGTIDLLLTSAWSAINSQF